MSLEKYQAKRNFKDTPEPVGAKEQAANQLIFVIQRHKASRLHYDLRLELDGVLKSWAVPKGPTLNPKDKRLAMMVEDHPYDYKDFEGVIPKGNYGAGIVEVWDKGTYDAVDEKGNTRLITDYKEKIKVLHAGLEAGNLKFSLNGDKVNGEFALVKLKGNGTEENAWLLIKHRDKFAVDEEYDSEEQTEKDSPINKWLAENKKPVKAKLKATKNKSEKVKEETPETIKKSTTATAKKKAQKLSDYIPAMLAKEADEPFSSSDWLYEIKWDGYRAIADINGGVVQLYSRNGISFVNNYLAVVNELKKIEIDAVLDGEIVVLDEAGHPSFQKLQHYDENRHLPLQYQVFDLLALDGKDLTSIPLFQRKELLRELLDAGNPVIKFSDHVIESGEAFFQVAKEKNLEGIMAKKIDSLYHPGKRTTEWLKIKHNKSVEAIVCGFTAPNGSRKYFGALVLGVYDGDQLMHVGHTGSGFDEKKLKEIFQMLEPIIVEDSPFEGKVQSSMPITWVTPQHVCEIKITEKTTDHKLRHPIFLGFREDKSADEITLESLDASAGINLDNIKESSEMKVPAKKTAKKTSKKTTKEVVKDNNPKPNQPETKPAKVTKEEKNTEEKQTKSKKSSNKVDDIKNQSTAKEDSSTVIKDPNDHTYKFGKMEVKTTNRSKIFFPDDGITKGQVIDYYDAIADYILPYLKGRPESLFRTPNGINSSGFFHKDAGDNAPKWVDHIELYSESVKRHIDYIICNNKATLLYMANLGCIEINPWHSTTEELDNPDYLIIDIDPSDNNTFEDVIEAANVVKSILDKAKATSICKTSGATGLHIYVPTGKQYTYDQVKDFAYVICMMANEQIPKITTLERSLSKRKKDRIYMDYLQNRRGQTIASVYSLRPKPGATASTPLEWKEVKSGLNPKDFNIFTMAKRLQEKGDLFGDALNNPIDLATCLENLMNK